MFGNRYFGPRMFGDRYWGEGTAAVIVAGPYYTDRSQIFAPGSVGHEVYSAGAVQHQQYAPGAVAVEVTT